MSGQLYSVAVKIEGLGHNYPVLGVVKSHDLFLRKADFRCQNTRCGQTKLKGGHPQKAQAVVWLWVTTFKV